MKNNNSKIYLFETMPVPKALATMAIPTIISQLINLIYNIVDTFYIGQTGNSYMVAGVTVAFTIFMMTVSFSNLFGVGGGSLMSRLSGQGEFQRAKQVCALSFYGAIAIALAYSLLIGFLMTPILNLLGASEDTILYARQYTWVVVVAGNLPIILSMSLAHLLRNAGFSTQASIGLSGGGILNIILDPLFMFVLLPKGSEVLGAAIATLLSNVASAVYLLLILKKESKNAPVSLSFKDMCRTPKEDVRGLFKVGIPSAILVGLFDVANIFLNALMSVHGDLQLAAIGIVQKAERVPTAINIGLAQGMLPIVAYNYSSGNHKRMKSVINTTRVVGLTIAFACVALYLLFASQIAGVFLSVSASDASASVATVGFAATFLTFRCCASPFQFLNYSTSYTLQAMADGRDTLLHAFVREFVFYVPFMYLFNHLWGASGLAVALPAGELCGGLFALLLLSRLMKRQNIQ